MMLKLCNENVTGKDGKISLELGSNNCQIFFEIQIIKNFICTLMTISLNCVSFVTQYATFIVLQTPSESVSCTIVRLVFGSLASKGTSLTPAGTTGFTGFALSVGLVSVRVTAPLTARICR